ncbi:hypothetical protein LJR129_005085 [Acidovorax sp. LjRoot129]|uniref:hypothetical protein n=1 Tax=unclassified Acidovorax TaxID=2684926 RepID=UPI003ECE5AF7
MTDNHTTATQLITIDQQALAILVACASTHVEDIETGLAEGLYEKAENQDLPEKQKAVQTAEALIRSMTESAKHLAAALT